MPVQPLFTRIRSFIKRKASQKYRFNLQYENKRWDGLRHINELGRYSVIVGYTRYFCRQARILDLGCGEGVLQEKFAAADYSYYLGIDFSEVAIENAKKTENDKTRFIVGDLNRLHAEGTFDAIIYNESLNYLNNPKAAVQSLFKNLDKDGVFIFSLVDKHHKEQEGLWNKLDEILEVQEKTKITNSAGDSWTVQVYKIRN